MTTLKPQSIMNALEPVFGSLPRFLVDTDDLTPVALHVEFRVPADGNVPDEKLNERVKVWFTEWVAQFTGIRPCVLFERGPVQVTYKPGDGFLSHEDQAWDRFIVEWRFGLGKSPNGASSSKHCVKVVNE